MCKLLLARQSKQYAEQVMLYKEEMLKMEVVLTVVQVLKMCDHLKNGLILKQE